MYHEETYSIIAGFVITMGAGPTNIQSNLKTIPYVFKRIGKVFPLHILMLSIRLISDYFHGIKTPIPVILLNITMLKSFISDADIYYSLGGVTWYLTLVCLFALLTPFLLKVISVIGKKGYCTHLLFLIVFFRIL